MKRFLWVVLSIAAFFSMAAVTGCDSIQNAMYKSAIEKAIHEDSLTGHEPTMDHVSAMRKVDISDCPPEFREAYSHHIHAWEEAAEVAQAKAKLDNDEDAAAFAGLVAYLADSSETPWSDHVEAVNQVRQLQLKAHDDIESTWQQVEDIARKYGVQM